jgi:hypothetical protein
MGAIDLIHFNVKDVVYNITSRSNEEVCDVTVDE